MARKEAIVKPTKKPKPEGPPCPKCGGTEGWTKPTYVPERTRTITDRAHPAHVQRHDAIQPAHLTRSCLVCGYPRKDAVKCPDPVTPSPSKNA